MPVGIKFLENDKNSLNKNVTIHALFYIAMQVIVLHPLM